MELVLKNFKNPGWRKHGAGAHVMVSGLNGGPTPGQSVSRELTDLHFGLGVDGNPQRAWVVGSFCVHVSEVREDVVGLGNFF